MPSWNRCRWGGDLGSASREELRRHAAQLSALLPRPRPRASDAAVAETSAALHARLTPLDESGSACETREVEVRRFDVDRVSFDHGAPLANRHAVVVLEGACLGRLVAEVQLSWCRYRSGGVYTSGGRVVRIRGA